MLLSQYPYPISLPLWETFLTTKVALRSLLNGANKFGLQMLIWSLSAFTQVRKASLVANMNYSPAGLRSFDMLEISFPYISPLSIQGQTFQG